MCFSRPRAEMARKVVKAESLFQPSGILVFLSTHLNIHFLDSIMVLRILYIVYGRTSQASTPNHFTVNASKSQEIFRKIVKTDFACMLSHVQLSMGSWGDVWIYIFGGGLLLSNLKSIEKRHHWTHSEILTCTSHLWSHQRRLIQRALQGRAADLGRACMLSEFSSSVRSLSRVRLFTTSWIAAGQATLSVTNSQSLLKLMPIESVMPSSHLILCHCLLLLPPIPPSIWVFSNESTLRIRWPKYWSFSFNISPSNEHPVLISFRMDWLDLLVVQGTLKSLLPYHSSKESIFRHSAFFTVQLSHPYMTTGKTREGCFPQNRGRPNGKESCLRDIRSPTEGDFLGGKKFSCGTEGGTWYRVQEWNASPAFP